ncbi:MAG: amidohydrolase [Clostridia bacterium]|nr:amidohydrolase [Clostridia bacterium]
MNNAKDYLEFINKVRQRVHSQAETGWQVQKTLEYLSSIAKKLNCQVFLTEYMMALFFDFNKFGCMAFRAELDALPIKEETQLPFKSTNGNMHACGHDGHMAIAMGLAKFLSDQKNSQQPNSWIKDLNKNILIVFEPAEEQTGGMEYLLSQEFIRQVGVECAFAIHLYPNLPKGKIFTKSNKFCIGSREIDLTIFGKALHVANLTKKGDTIAGCVEFLAKNNKIYGKRGFIRFCELKGGVANNITCDEIRLKGSMRFFGHKELDGYARRLKRRLAKTCNKYGLSFSLDVKRGVAPIVCNKEMIKKAKKVTQISKAKRQFICDDFSEWGKKIPIAYFLMGTGGKYPLHSPYFDFDQNLLATALDFCINFVKVA